MLIKKLVVPFLALAIASIGACSSDSPTTTGTGGAKGSGGTQGSGGAGSGGTTGSGGAGSGGTVGSGGAVVDAPVDMPVDMPAETASETGGEVALAACSVSTNTDPTEKLTAEAFCQNFIAECTGTTAAGSPYLTMATCVTSYNAAVGPHCQSYHLCWGVEGKGGGPGQKTPHCGHAAGAAPCNAAP
jgi:hypothetical protein